MKQMLGEDEGVENTQEETSSPGGIIVETLLNMGTVSALTMEEERYKNYQDATKNLNEHYVLDGLREGVLAGLSMFIQQWINALQLYFGGWLLYKYPEKYGFNDFLISNFAILFSLFGLGAAFQDISDRKETEKSASRIFYLLDRKSSIDPLSEEGEILDTSVDRPKPKKKISVSKMKQKRRASSLKNIGEEPEINITVTEDSKDSLECNEEEGETPEREISKGTPSSPEKKTKSSTKKKKSKGSSSKKLLTKVTDDEDNAIFDNNSNEAIPAEQEEEREESRRKSMKKKKSSKKKKKDSKPNAGD